jgi:hypothetical protein
MKSYNGTFLKKDGSERTMRFVKIEDLPPIIIDGMIKGTGKKIAVQEGSELVYDLDSKQLRTFNHSTVVGKIVEIELDESSLV